MRRLRGVVAGLALCACLAARADGPELVQRRPRRSPAATVTRDMLWGGLAGAAVSGAIVGYRLGVQDQPGYDWVPVLVTGVGIGLAGGAVLGVVDALTHRPEPPADRPAHDGLSFRDQHPNDLSGQKIVPLWAGRF